LSLRDRLDGAASADGHERRRLHDAMRRSQFPASGGALMVEDTELKVGRHAGVSISKSAKGAWRAKPPIALLAPMAPIPLSFEP
jgi:hypothetical protein